MDDKHFAGIDGILDKSEFSLEAILAEYKKDADKSEKRPSDSYPEERSRAIVIDAISETIKRPSKPVWEEIPPEEFNATHELARTPEAKPSPSRGRAVNIVSGGTPPPDVETVVEGYDDFGAGEYSSLEEMTGGDYDTGGDYESGTDYDAAEDYGGAEDYDVPDEYDTPAEDDYAEDYDVTGEPETPVENAGKYKSAGDGAVYDKYEARDYEDSEQHRNSRSKIPDKYDDGEYYDEEYDDSEDEGYAAGDYPELEPAQKERLEKPYYTRGKGFSRVLISILAAAVTLRQKRDRGGAPEHMEDTDIPEPPPGKSARHYASQMKTYRFRGRAAAFLCVIAVYITFAFDFSLPLPSAFSSLRITAAVCLIIELSVMICGLDIFTNGLVSIGRRRPGAESLMSVSCLVSILDAALIMAGFGGERGAPFCAVSALAVAFAIWGSRLTCSGYRATFRAAGLAASPCVVTAAKDTTDEGDAAIKTKRGIQGFTRKSEEPDMSETAYGYAAPFILVSAPILALLASAAKGRGGDFAHVYSAIAAAGAAFSAFVAFGWPFAQSARQLLAAGASAAGFSGAADIARCKRVVVTDGDVFPSGTVAIATATPMEGVYTHRLISYTGSLLAAFGSALAPVFADIIRENGYAMYEVTDFVRHESGGLEATVCGERVMVGTSGFMNLRGVRLTEDQSEKDTVFTAVNDVLVGIFRISYTPKATVRDALVTLLSGRKPPYFAIRDFNITPLLISQKYKIPAESIEFTSFSDRCEVSDRSSREDSAPPAAVLSRDSLAGYAEVVEQCSKLYRGVRFNTILSVAGSVTGVLLMYFLCRTGAYDSATASNTMTFMLLWLLPVLIKR